MGRPWDPFQSIPTLKLPPKWVKNVGFGEKVALHCFTQKMQSCRQEVCMQIPLKDQQFEQTHKFYHTNFKLYSIIGLGRGFKNVAGSWILWCPGHGLFWFLWLPKEAQRNLVGMNPRGSPETQI